MTEALLLLGSFLFGSIPVGYLVAKAKGIDILHEGSGNIGTTNVIRVLGPGLGLFVFVLDVLKGYVPAMVGHMVFHSQEWSFAAGVTAVLGHSFSPFLKFKGGKGIASGLGMFLGASPMVGLGALAIFTTVMATTLVVSMASITAALVLLPFGLLFKDPNSLLIAYGVVGVFIAWRHAPNIKRIIAKEEPRFAQKPGQEPKPTHKMRIAFVATTLLLIAGVYAIYLNTAR